MRIHQDTKIEMLEQDLLLISTADNAGQPVVHLARMKATSPEDAHGTGGMMTLNADNVQHLFDAMQTGEKCVIQSDDKEMSLQGYLETHRDNEGKPYLDEYVVLIYGLRSPEWGDSIPGAGPGSSKIAYSPSSHGFSTIMSVLDHNIGLRQELEKAPSP